MERKYNILLIGFMGAGKSAIAGHLQKEYGMNMIDMDEEIVKREGMSISEIFKSRGEPYFRNLETKLLIELQQMSNQVVSCGGGVAMRSENVAEMKKNGRVVLLRAKPETIYERVKDSTNRPLLAGNMNVAYISELMELRRPKYKAAADVMIDTDGKSVDEICRELLEKVEDLSCMQ